MSVDRGNRHSEVSERRGTNREIVEDLRKGTERGYRRFSNEYRKRLIHEAVSSYNVSRDDAEELANDVLMVVAAEIDRFRFRDSDNNFRSWVLTIFRNRIRDHMRKCSTIAHLRDRLNDSNTPADRSLMLSLDNEVVVSSSRGATRPAEPDSDKTSGSRLDQLSEALESLAPWEQVLLRCRAMGIPYEDIAKYTGKKATILKVYHRRVCEKLRRRVGEGVADLPSRGTKKGRK